MGKKHASQYANFGSLRLWQARTRIISNSSTPIEIYNKYIYNVDVETDRLLPASAKCARFLITDNKNVISKSIKHIFFRRYATNIGIFS